MNVDIRNGQCALTGGIAAVLALCVALLCGGCASGQGGEIVSGVLQGIGAGLSGL